MGKGTSRLQADRATLSYSVARCLQPGSTFLNVRYISQPVQKIYSLGL
jgi:hypothetical protein